MVTITAISACRLDPHGLGAGHRYPALRLQALPAPARGGATSGGGSTAGSGSGSGTSTSTAGTTTTASSGGGGGGAMDVLTLLASALMLASACHRRRTAGVCNWQARGRGTCSIGRRPNRRLTGVVARPKLPLTQFVSRWTTMLVPLALAASARLERLRPILFTPRGGCDTRVIMALPPKCSIHRYDRFVADLERATDVQLTFVSIVARNLFLFTLSGAAGDVDCRPAPRTATSGSARPFGRHR